MVKILGMIEITAKTPLLSYLAEFPKKDPPMAQPVEENYWEIYDYDKGRNVLHAVPDLPKKPDEVYEHEYRRRVEKALFRLKEMRGNGIINFGMIENILEGKE
jgi:hypothetical protein